MTPNKILFATEVPTAHLDQLNPLVDWHFCIASECLKDPKYFNWYINRPRGAKVMLDNGMFEEGKPLSPDILYDIADAIKPNVVFAPDLVGFRERTLSMTSDFIDMCEQRKAPWSVGVIPQGSCPSDIVQCHNDMVSEFHFDGPIGISFLNNRPEVCRLLSKGNHWHENLWYHFLGLYNLDEIAQWPSHIRSMDTIKPFKAAMHGYALEECPRGLGKWDTSIRCADTSLLYRNYAKMHQTLTRR